MAGFIEGADRAQLSLFGDLPNGDRFIARLRRICDADHLDPSVVYTDQQCLAQSLRTEEKAIEEALEIVRRHLKQQVALLRCRGFRADAQTLDLVQVRQGTGYVAAPDLSAAFSAWERSFDIVIDAKEHDNHWLYCLEEACGGLTRHNFATHWLMRDWLDLPVDLEPIKELFIAHYRFQIDGDACNVFKVR